MRLFFFYLLLLTCPSFACCDGNYTFKEIWAYVLKTEEKFLQGHEPITDIGYFSATVSDTGRLKGTPDIEKIPASIRQGKRIHLVISAPGNLSLMYWCLTKDQETRNLLIQDILQASVPFDGLQIDFETIRPEEGPAYWSFLKELKAKLPPNKVFSVAVPARTKEVKDAFDYKEISQIADRVIIMAYDEHWRTGPPGPIASLAWCQRVCDYSKKVIPAQKLVMGLPLYGRVWQKEEIARALKYFQTLELWKEHPNLLKRDNDGTPHFAFEQPVHADVYFEDVQSLGNKLAHYQEANVSAVAFWRQSQGPAALWGILHIQSNQ